MKISPTTSRSRSTARRRAETHQRRTKQIIDSLDTALAAVAEDGAIIETNDAYRRLYARDRDGALLPARAVEYDDRRGEPLPRNQTTLARAARGEALEDERIWLYDTDKHWHALEATTTPIDSLVADRRATLLIIEDVTERLESAEARRTMTAVVSHELRNPLTAVIGHVDLLLERDDLPAKVAERLETIASASERMQQLVATVLDETRPKPATLSEPVDLRQVVDASVESFCPTATAAGLTLDVEGAETLLIYGDAFRLRQAFDNVISNAVKYTGPGGQITARLVSVDRERAEVRVTDTGSGMSPDDATDHSVVLVAIVTITTALVIGLATLARPWRATITWGVGYGLGMLGTYLSVAAEQMESSVLRGISTALKVSFVPFVWVGLRMLAGRRRSYLALAIAFTVLAPVLLGIAALTSAYPLAFRVGFLVAVAFAGLITFELVCDRRTRQDIALSLALVGGAFAVIAVVVYVMGLLTAAGAVPFSSEEQLDLTRDVNRIGTIIISVCASFTLVLLVRSAPAPSPAADDVTERARQRLRKASAQRAQSWSVLDVRLDDPSDLREAWTPATYARILENFHECVVDLLPASADAHRVSEVRILVLIYGTNEAVRHYLRTMLGRLSSIDDDGPLASVRISASVGWATVDVAGYDYDILVESAAEGAELARERGGDRWERMRRAPSAMAANEAR